MMLYSLPGIGQSFTKEKLEWGQLPDLPPALGQSQQPGLAGAFSGAHHNALIIAGGANFPDAPPWEDGTKVWQDEIYVLEKTTDGYRWHTDPQFKLPLPLAYGVSVATDEGLLCIGGNNQDQVSDRVFIIQWQPETGTITIEEKPPMPHPLAMMAGARVNDEVYVAGGQITHGQTKATNTFLSLDLRDFSWKTLPSWPGPSRIVPVAASQSNGSNDCFYLFSGRNAAPGQETEILSDAYRYNPVEKQWKKLANISLQQDISVMAGTAIGSGANHILMFGGDDGRLFQELEELDRLITQAADTLQAAAFVQQKQDILTNHPGFSKRILAYHTITDTWNTIGELPAGSQVTTNAVRWEGDIIIPSGEIRPGIRTPRIWQANIVITSAFGWINFSVLGVYLMLLVGVGIFLAKREGSTEDYFTASGRIPWWAAGLSIFGTQLSALTFMAIPAKTYATDWSYFMLNMTIIMVAPIIVYGFLPFYRRLHITTAYEYLEKRFNLAVRLAGGLMFIIFQFGRIGIVLFLPSLALSLVTGIDVSVCILLMGGLSIFYTVLGGIEAVIWTDVVQVIVLLGGALLSLMLLVVEAGGINSIIDIAADQQKFHVLDFSLDLSRPTFWVVVLGGLGANLISYGSDQTVVQRYLTTQDEKSAAQSIWVSAWLTLPATLLFFSIGTALFVFYQLHPNLMNAVALDNTDAIFPYYIVTQLPTGVAGLLIAGIFAAAMSSLDSSMNSIATVVTQDGYRRFRPQVSDRTALRLAQWTTALVGIAGTAFALVMAGWNIKSLWDQFNTFIGLFAGGLGGLFLLGMFTRKANGPGAVIGLIVSGLVQYAIKEYTPTYLLLYTLSGIVSCVAVGYLASFFFEQKPDKVEGLTIYTQYRTIKKKLNV
jgi:cyclically-permuted mutarotase family protein